MTSFSDNNVIIIRYRMVVLSAKDETVTGVFTDVVIYLKYVSNTLNRIAESFITRKMFKRFAKFLFYDFGERHNVLF